jgi:hypothetical protein
MAVPKVIRKLLIGSYVKLKKPIHRHDLHIPKGTVGYIMSVSERGTSAMIGFDDGRKYGKFECWFKDLDPA